MAKPRALRCGGVCGRREATTSTRGICALHNELSRKMLRCNKTPQAVFAAAWSVSYRFLK